MMHAQFSTIIVSNHNFDIILCFKKWCKNTCLELATKEQKDPRYATQFRNEFYVELFGHKEI